MTRIAIAPNDVSAERRLDLLIEALETEIGNAGMLVIPTSLEKKSERILCRVPAEEG